MSITPFYTVIESSIPTYPVMRFYIRYVLPPCWTVQEFPEVNGFNDPGEATREFKKYARFQNAELLTKGQFEKRILQHDQDMRKLASWTGGNP